MNHTLWCVALLWLLPICHLNAQFVVKTEAPDVHVGEAAMFTVLPSVSGTLTYDFRNDFRGQSFYNGSINVVAGRPYEIRYAHPAPEFVFGTFKLNGLELHAGASFSLEEITQCDTEPADFDSFWAQQKNLLNGVALNPILQYEYTNRACDVYKVTLNFIDGRKVYGRLAVPQNTGPKPAVLVMPAFGASTAVIGQPEYEASFLNAIVFAISIHNTPVDIQDPLAYQPDNIWLKDGFYYRWSVLAGIQALNYLESRSDYDGEHLIVEGISQGGGLATMVAGVDSRVDILGVSNPALAAHSCYLLNQRSTSFPYWIEVAQAKYGAGTTLNSIIDNVPYYDAINFAKRFHGKAFLISSYEDVVCPAATTYQIWQNFDGEKILLHNIAGGHNSPNEFFTDYQKTVLGFVQSQAKGFIFNIQSGGFATVNQPHAIAGEITFDGAAINKIKPEWRLKEGPGVVYFDDPEASQTTATFSTPGVYTLVFKAEDFRKSGEEKYYTFEKEFTVSVSGNARPGVTLSKSGFTNSGFLLDATFTEDVTGLTASDWIVAGGSVTALSGNGSSYSLTVTPIASEASISIGLPEMVVNAVSDNEGNIASNQVTYYVESPCSFDAMIDPVSLPSRFNSVGEICANTQNGFGNFTYNWSTGSTSPCLTNVPEGDYAVTITSTNSGCSQVLHYTLKEFKPIDLDLSIVPGDITPPQFVNTVLTFTLTNSGLQRANSITVDVPIPPGSAFVSAYSTNGVYNSFTHKWLINRLQPGASTTLSFTIYPNTTGEIPVYGQVWSVNEDDVDSEPGNAIGLTVNEDDETLVVLNKQTSAGCSIQPVLKNLVCNDLGTPSDPNDDEYTFEITASGIGGSVSPAFVVEIDNVSSAPIAYGNGLYQSNSYLISGGSFIARLKDQNNSTCSAIVQIVPPNACSNPGNGSNCGSTSNFPWHEWISEVSLGNISHASLKSVDNDFTNILFEATQGQLAALSVKLGFSYLSTDEYVRVWMDFDNNGTYEAGELVLDEVVNAIPYGRTSEVVTKNILIPADAHVGSVNMRAVVRKSAAPNSCEVIDFGEAEDYKLNISESVVTSCLINATADQVTCNDNGTATDATDDTFTARVNITGVSQWNIYVDGSLAANGSQATHLIGPFNIADGSVIVEVRDANNSACTTTLSIAPPSTCSVTSPPTADYCEVQSDFPWHDWIKEVSLEDIQNISSKTAYTYYDSPAANVEQGGIYDILLTAGFSYFAYDEYWQVWIDFNHNGVFETGERVFAEVMPKVGDGINEASIGGEIDIPLDATIGETRMRVIMTRGGYGLPCEDIDNGEIEDYLVNIEAGNGQASCRIRPTVTSVGCDDNGTSSDGLDDLFFFIFEVTATNNTSTNWVLLDASQNQVATGLYGQAFVSDSFDISMQSVNYTIQDGNDASCSANISVATPGHCSQNAGAEEYCVPNSDFPWHEWISEVTVGQQIFQSGKSSYSDFTSEIFNVTRGVNTNLEVKVGFSWETFAEYIIVWIDANQNNVFEASEIVLNDQMNPPAFTMPGAVSGVINLGANTALGLTRMRVMSSREEIVDPCASLAYGEFEDYSINVMNTANGASAFVQPFTTVLSAKLIGGGVELQGDILAKEDIVYLQVERFVEGSKIGIQTIISEQASIKEGTAIIKHLSDPSPAVGVNHYRLALIGKSGLKYTSDWQTVLSDQEDLGLQLFPNPVSETLVVSMGAKANLYQSIVITDITGAIVDHLTVQANGLGNQGISVQNLNAGCYYINLQSNVLRTITKPFFVIK